MRRRSAAVLTARQEHYGNKISAKGVFITIAPFALFFTVPSWVIWHSWEAALVVFIVAFIVGCSTQISPNISISYYRNVLKQEQLFMSEMTLALSQHSQTPINALDRSQNGLQGEFRTDMAKLEDTIHNTAGNNTMRVHNAFEKVRHKYRSDNFFCQYMQLIENSFSSGAINREAIDNINDFHNAQFQAQKRYITIRHNSMISVWVLNIMLTLILWGTQLFIFHVHTWCNLFAWHPVGIIAGIIYVLILAGIYFFALSWDHDESIVNY